MNGQISVEVARVLDLSRTKRKIVSVNKPIESEIFEKNRFPYLVALPLMWVLTIYVMIKKAIYGLFKLKPRTNTLLFDGLGPWTRKVKEGSASWRALHIIYNHPFKKRNNINGWIDEFWWCSLNCQSVRNRFKLAKQEVRKAILKFDQQQEIRILSLACGSAQAIIELMAEFKEKGTVVRVMLLDIDKSALDYALNLASQNGVGDQVEFINSNISQAIRLHRDFKPQIVEMLGFLDYLSQKQAIRLVSKIYQGLNLGSILLTCNIRKNTERFFVYWVINWPMIYRSPSKLLEVAEKSGFVKYRIIYEPLKIHGLLIVEK